MAKRLKLSSGDRIGCRVSYSINQFLVFHKNGALLTTARDKGSLREQLSLNGIKIADTKFDGIALKMWAEQAFGHRLCFNRKVA